jgi:flagellar protein FliO/FliZ
LCIVFAICAFNLSIINLYAQEVSVPDEEVLGGYSRDETATAPESPVADPRQNERNVQLEDSGTGATPSASATSVWGILRVLLTLALAAAAIYGLVFFIKRVSRGGKTQDPFLKLLASTPIGTNRSVHIIAAGTQAWLVGAAENGVNVISEIEDKDLLNAMLLEDSRKNATETMETGHFPDFRALLRKMGVQVGAKAPGAEDIRKRSEKLKGL